MALQIIRNNIVNVEADAIVNTANPMVAVGRGVDSAIYEAAGRDKLLEARAAIGEMKTGEVAYTPAFDLNAKYIIHAIGPAWMGGDHGEREAVAACYSKALALADELKCESIAFPLMATGTYGFPKDEALQIAIREISTFLLAHEMEVYLVVYDKESFEVSGKLFAGIKSYLEEDEELFVGSAIESDEIADFDNSLPQMSRILEYSEHAHDEEDMSRREMRARRRLFGNRIGHIKDLHTEDFHTEDFHTEDFNAEQMVNYAPSKSLADRIENLDKTFQEHLFMLIDRRGLTDPEVYKKANIDRKLFSKIRNNIDYAPSKRTAVALAIALELSLDETKDLLMKAGYALSPSSTFDKIIEYCIEEGEYDVHTINIYLFDFDQPILGA